ncbi:serendipity alpha isoform X2 [Oratosquilla oratoria]|uniref:serendipity alpha isoform X2 n=1 Tax=Oratosquilla oratoria TaxID=337810 RepID=UPI003F75A1C1
MDKVEGCTKAKSVLNTLGPIAKQVVELKSRHGIVCEASTVLHLLHQCTTLKAACQHLVECLLSFAHHHNHRQLTTCVVHLQKDLQDAVEEIKDATRDLHKGDVDKTKEVWSSLVECTENLLSILVSALLAWDNANIHQIEICIGNFTKSVENLKEIRIVQDVPVAFQEVADAAISLFSALEQRCADMSQKKQEETVQLLSLQLRHMLPLLAASTVACVQHPVSKCLKSTREVVIRRVRDVLTDLKEVSGQGKPHYDVEEDGIFVKHVDKVIEILVEAGANQKSIFVKEKVQAPLEEVLRHAIAVAHSSCEQDKKVIMTMCENVLKQLHAVAAKEHSGAPDTVDIHVSCEILTDCLELLERGVNTALIRLIVQTMADPFVPIKALVETLHPKDGKIPVDRETLRAKIEEFEQHVDNLLLVGGFAIACTTDTKRVLQIRDVILTLEWLEPCLISSIVTAHEEIISSKGDLCQQHNWILSQMLIKHWKMAIRQLKECFDFLLDPPAFTLVSQEEVHKAWAEVKGSLYTQNTVWLSHHVHHTRAVINHLLDLHKTTPFLSEVQVDDIELASQEIMSCLRSALEAPEDRACRRSLLKRLQFALTVVSRLSSSLNEDNSAMDITEEHLSQNHVSEQAQQTSYCELPPGIVTAETTVRADVSIDISKFLSHSTNAFHCSSTRTSRRNFTLKVREIQVNLDSLVKEPKKDLEAVQHVVEPESDREDDKQEAEKVVIEREKSVTEEEENQQRELNVGSQTDSSIYISSLGSTTLPSLLSFSSLASHHHRQASLPSTLSTPQTEHLTVNPDVSNITCPGEELSEILENLTSIAGSLSALTSLTESEKTKSETVLVAGSENLEKRKSCSVANCAEEGQEPFKTERMSTVGAEKVGWSPLKGIIIHDTSFTPEFPSIGSGDTTEEIFCDVSGCKGQRSSVHEPSEFGIFSSNNETSVWQDFTRILKAVTPAKSELLNFTDNFSEAFAGWFTRLTTPIQNQENFKDKTALSVKPRKTPFKDTKDISSNSCSPSPPKRMSLVKDNSLIYSSTSSLPSNISVSSASASVSTPQRICDIHKVNQRLAVLKESQE